MTMTQILHSALESDKFSEHARWIAIVIGIWNQIEEQIGILYGGLIDSGYTKGMIAFYAVQNNRARFNTITSIINRYHNDEIQQEWKKLSRQLKKGLKYRDTVAHANWAPNSSDNNELELRSTRVGDNVIEAQTLYPVKLLRQQAKYMNLLGGRISLFNVHLIRSRSGASP